VRLRAVHPVIPVAALYPHAAIVAWGKAPIRVILPVLTAVLHPPLRRKEGLK